MSVDEITYDVLRRWLASDQRVVIASLVEVIGSAPLNPGALMLFGEQGEIEGSVTGGCVEGALAEEARRTLREARPPQVLTFGISDELAGHVGLMCGGTVRIFLGEITSEARATWRQVLDAVASHKQAAVATVVTGSQAGEVAALVGQEKIGSIRGALLNHSLKPDMDSALRNGASTLRRYGSDGAVMGGAAEVFIRVFGRQPRLIIIGAIDFSVAVAKLAGELGYAVSICDAREAFLKSERFGAFAEVVRDWPGEYLRRQAISSDDVILVFSHDRKFDEPALIAALETTASFIGAMGSRKTVADRQRRLREAGVSDEDLRRVISPVGLDIGAATPAETAVSVLAEILLLRAGRSGMRLSQSTGSIRGSLGPRAMVTSGVANKA